MISTALAYGVDAICRSTDFIEDILNEAAGCSVTHQTNYREGVGYRPEAFVAIPKPFLRVDITALPHFDGGPWHWPHQGAWFKARCLDVEQDESGRQRAMIEVGLEGEF